jgi:hypothetical protein
MKKLKLLFTILCILLPFISFAQFENDVEKIIEIVVKDYRKDSIDICFKFENVNLLNDIESARSNYHYKLLEKYSFDDLLSFENNWELIEPEELRFEGINVHYENSKKLIKKKSKKKIKKYVKGKYQTDKSTRPLAFISIPLISQNNDEAIVYVSYTCGGLCGSGGIIYFKKINYFWERVDYQLKWVS